MKVRHAYIPRHYLLDDSGLRWPGVIDLMPCFSRAEVILGGMNPANDVKPGVRELPDASDENLLKIAREYRRLFGSTQPRQRLGGDVGRLLFGRRARPTG